MTPPMSAPVASAPLDLAPEDFHIVRGILRGRIPGLRVVAYGSRARGRARPFSDLDLAVVSDRPVAGKVMALLANDFTQSNLPMRVDLSEWRDFSAEFRRRIAADCVAVQDGDAPRHA